MSVNIQSLDPETKPSGYVQAAQSSLRHSVPPIRPCSSSTGEKEQAKKQNLEDPLSLRLAPQYNSSDCASNNNKAYKYEGKSLCSLTAGTRRRRPWRELAD